MGITAGHMMTGPPQSAASWAPTAVFIAAGCVALCIAVFVQGVAPIDSVMDKAINLVAAPPATIHARPEPSNVDFGDLEMVVSGWKVLL